MLLVRTGCPRGHETSHGGVSCPQLHPRRQEPERRAVYEANIAQIPGLRRLAAIDASAQDRFWRDFEEQQVRFADSVLMDTRSVGQVALTLSRLHALRWQVRHNVSWMCMMEDDVAVLPGFVERVEALADSLSPAVRQGLLRVVRLSRRERAAPR